jgi:hypothetical protein
VISFGAKSQAITLNDPQDTKKGQIEASLMTSTVISPIPMNPAEMSRMLALGKEKFSIYEIPSKDLIGEANGLVIIDEQSHRKSVELGLRASKFSKEIDKKRKEFTKYADEFSDGLRDFVKPFINDCQQVVAIMKQKESSYFALTELERRKQQKILEDAQKEVQAKVDAEAKAAGVETVQIQTPIVKEEEKVVTQTEYGSATMKPKKDFKVMNLSLVPREYLERAISKDPYKLLKPIIDEEIKKNPEIEIEGVLIFDSAKVTYR